MASGGVWKAFNMTIEDIRNILTQIIYEKLEDSSQKSLSSTDQDSSSDQNDNNENQTKAFNIDDSKKWSQQIGNDVKERLKELSVDPNYKYWVSVIIGELKGQGVELSSHCSWDYTTDNTISCWYANDLIYWFVLVFVVYRAPTVEQDVGEDEIPQEHQE